MAVLDLEHGGILVAGSDGAWDNLGVSTLEGLQGYIQGLVNPHSAYGNVDGIAKLVYQSCLRQMHSPHRAGPRGKVPKPDNLTLCVARVAISRTEEPPGGSSSNGEMSLRRQLCTFEQTAAEDQQLDNKPDQQLIEQGKCLLSRFMNV